MTIICNIQVDIPSAPALIQDLLFANGEALPVKAICRAGALIGVGESAIRVALNRLVTQGKIAKGARGLYSMNSTISALSRVVDDWQHESVRTIPWQGSWLGVQDAGILRSDKTSWRHHNLALALCGFRLFQPGLHLRPDNLTGGTQHIREQLQELGLASQAVVFRLDQLNTEHQQQALSLWAVDTLSSEYTQIKRALQISAEKFSHGALEDSVRESLLLGRTVISRLVKDPLLPAEIAPLEIRLSLTDEMTIYQNKARVLWKKWLILATE